MKQKQTHKNIQKQKQTYKKMIGRLNILETGLSDLDEITALAIEENPYLKLDENYFNRSIDFDDVLSFAYQEPTLQEILLEQIDPNIDKKVYRILIYLIHNLDKNGYLSLNDEEKEHFNPKAYKEALHILKSMQPVGVGTESFLESLLLQLSELKSNAVVEKAKELLMDYSEAIISGNFKMIQTKMDIDGYELEIILELIKRLKPHPFTASNDRSQYIRPDILVKVKDHTIEIELVDHRYMYIIENEEILSLKGIDHKQTQEYIQAQELLHALTNRNLTIFRVSKYIINKQQAFFIDNETLKPLEIKEIATKLKLHESTISRAIKNKYLEFANEIYPLNYFMTLEVSETSQEHILKIIKQIIETEDKDDPFTDKDIQLFLEDEGITLGRSTISKYRNILNIKPAHKRKQ